MMVAALLRCWQLPNESAWWDEVVTLRCLPEPALGAFIRCERAKDPPMTPVYFTLAHAWSRIFSPDERVMRILSIITGLSSIVLLYVLGRRIINANAGLIAAAAMAVSLPHVYYSQEIRVYALVMLLAILSMYALAGAMSSKGPAWWVLHLAINALLAFTHLFSVFLFVAQGLYLAACRRRRIWIPWGVAHGIVAIGLATWLLDADFKGIHGAASWMARPGWREAIVALLIFAGGRPTNENPSAHLSTGVSLDFPLAVLVFGLIGWYLLHIVKTGKKGRWTCPDMPVGNVQRPIAHCRRPYLILLWLAVPTMGLFAVSWLWRPCFVPRYVLYASLPVYLLLGAAVDAIPRRWAKRAVLSALLLLYGHQASAVAVGPFRPDWRSACRYVEAQAGPEDTFIAFQDLNLWAMAYHSRWPRERLDCALVWSEIPAHVRKAHDRGGTAWVAVWLWADPSRIEARFRENGWLFTDTDFKGWPRLRIYRVNAPQN
ncbi:MAG TPA: glycosyltransferase family 39 protein [Candidatus Hydrogenedentes bacterium]|nr:glycosyltransferase family 39 protein [Candidatus Hydrogenedentota bacterium]